MVCEGPVLPAGLEYLVRTPVQLAGGRKSARGRRIGILSFRFDGVLGAYLARCRQVFE